jgi:iron complex outermembrane recepter protein
MECGSYTDRRRGRFIPAGLILALFAGASEGAPSRLSDLDLEQLLQVEVVSVSRRSERASEAAAAISVITGEDIRRSGATSIPEALRLAPGVEVSRIDANKWAIGIRGFQSRLARSTLVLVDGRSVYTPLFAGTYWENQDVLLEDIERIEVIRGPGGTQWGANAVNGVINIITRPAADTQGRLVSAIAGTHERSLAGRVGGALDDGHYRAWAKQFYRDGGDRPDNPGFDDWQMGRAGFRVDREPSPRDTLTLQGDAYQGESGQRTAITTFSPPATFVRQGDADLVGASLRGRWSRALDPGRELAVQAWYDRSDRRELSFEETRDTFDVDAQLRLALGADHDLTMGAGYRVSRGDFSGLPTVRFIPARYTEQLFSAFVQDEWRLGERTRLIAGTKVEHNDYSGFEWQPTVRAAWTPAEGQTLWSAVSRAVRTPSRIEAHLEIDALVDPGPPLFARYIGDGNFDPEELTALEAGWRARVTQALNADLAVFHNRYRNLLSVEPGAVFAESDPAPAHFVLPIYLRNRLRGTVQGLEAAADWVVRDGWRLRLSHSVLIMDLEAEPGSGDTTTVRGNEGSSPHHQSLLRSAFNLGHGIEVDLQLRHVADLPAQGVPSYTAFDARIGWQATPELALSLMGSNLLDRSHPEFGGGAAGLTEVPRSVYLKAVYRW